MLRNILNLLKLWHPIFCSIGIIGAFTIHESPDYAKLHALHAYVYLLYCPLSSEFWVSTIICVLHFFFFLFPIWIWLLTCEQWVLRSVGWCMKINETLYVKAREKNLYWNFGKYITMKICRIFQSHWCIPMCTQDQNSQMYQAL